MAQKKLIERVNDIKDEIGILKKDAKNPLFNSDYIKLETLIKEIKPICSKHQVMVQEGLSDRKVFLELIDETKLDNVLEFSMDLGIIPAEVLFQSKGANVIQMVCQTTTYFRRMLWSTTFSVVAVADLDGNSGHPTPPPPIETPKPLQKKTTFSIDEKLVNKYQKLLSDRDVPKDVYAKAHEALHHEQYTDDIGKLWIAQLETYPEKKIRNEAPSAGTPLSNAINKTMEAVKKDLPPQKKPKKQVKKTSPIPAEKEPDSPERKELYEKFRIVGFDRVTKYLRHMGHINQRHTYENITDSHVKYFNGKDIATLEQWVRSRT